MNVSPRPGRRTPFAGRPAAALACLCLSLLIAGSAFAAPPPHDELGSLLACRNIAAAAGRLQCFDRTSAALVRAEAAADATASSARVAAAKAPESSATATEASAHPSKAFDPHQTFGLSSAAILAREVRSGARRESLSSITARVTGLGAAPDGRMIYSLDDGQTWRELVADGEAPRVRSGDRVKISRGWLGSFWMQTASGEGCKVERLR